MPTQGAAANTDSNGKLTTAYYQDRGDGTSNWQHVTRTFDGGDVTIGAKADTAVTAVDTTPGSVIALLKGIISKLAVGASTLLKAEDAPHASGDAGVMALAVRRDAPTADASAGDYHALHVDAFGRLRVTGTHLEDDPAASGDAGTFMLAIRRDTQTSDTAAGDYHGLHVDALGRLRVADRNEPTVAKTTALATSLVVKASAGKLLGFAGYSTTAQFIQVHDTTSLPADTAVPVLVFPIEANKPFSIKLPGSHPCATGITICNSTTGPTKTIGSANTWITAYYE
jgi:hypothetical protein